MNIRHLQGKLAGAILGFSLLFGIGVASGITGQAQDPSYRDTQDGRAQDSRDRNESRGRDWDSYGNYGGSFQLRQTALNAGYNEGIKAGREDRQRGRRADYRGLSTYQKATKDYSSRLGDRELYRHYFREAFENGHNDEGYAQGGGNRDYRDRDRDRNGDGYGNYGGSFQLRQTALNAGYNEGMEKGRNDRKKNSHSDYRGFSAYQKATSDYSSKLGDRDLYRQYYREAYENGYNDGYDGG
jgi:hypothetical protein